MKIGLDYPIRRSPSDGFFAGTETTAEETRTTLLYVLNTQKGERPMHPDFGTELRQALFEPANERTRVQVEEEIRAAIERYVPYVNLEQFAIERGRDQSRLKVSFSTQFNTPQQEIELLFQTPHGS